MRVVSGVKIYFNNAVTDASLGIVNGVAIWSEDVQSGALHTILAKDWDSGFKMGVDLRSYPMPMSVEGGTVRFSNVAGQYDALEALGCNLKGAKVDRIMWVGLVETSLASFYVKDVDVSKTAVTITLGDISTQRNTSISKPVSAKVEQWFPVVFGYHEYGLLVYGGRNRVVRGDTGNIVYNIEGSKIQFNPLGDYVYPGFVPGSHIEFTSGAYGVGDILKVNDGFLLSETVDGYDVWGVFITDNPPITVEGESLYKGLRSSTISDASSFRFLRIEESYHTDQWSSASIVAGTRFSTVDGDDVSNLFVQGFGNYAKIVNTYTDSNRNYTEFESVDINPDIDITQYTQFNQWQNQGNGVWTWNSNVTSISISETGTAENTIDKVSTTFLRTDVTAVTDTYSTPFENMRFGSAKVITVDNFDPNMTGLMIDVDFTRSAAFQDNWDVNDFGVRVYYDWTRGGFNYPPVIDSDNKLDSRASFSSGTENNVVVFRNTIDQYYTNKDTYSNRFYVDNGLYQDNNVISAFGYERFKISTSNIEKLPRLVIVVYQTYNVPVFQSSTPNTITSSFYIKNISAYTDAVTINTDSNFVCEVNGRPYTTPEDIFRHIVRLQNATIDGLIPPPEGWGFAENTNIPVYLNNTPTIPMRAQIVEKDKMNVASLSAQLCTESWCIRYLERNGVDALRGVADSLGVPVAGHVAITDLVNGRVTAAPVFNAYDLFNTFEIQYDYNAQTGGYNSTISVTGVSNETYDSSYVQGVSSPSSALLLWTYAREMYLAAGRENKLPDAKSKLMFIYEEDDAVNYLINCMQWYGIKDGKYADTHRVTSEHDISILDSVWIGSDVVVSAKNITSPTVDYTGIVTSIEYMPNDRKRVRLESIVRAEQEPVTIVERIENTDFIIEQVGNTDFIIERV